MLHARLAGVHVQALLRLDVVWCENFAPKDAAALRELVPELTWMTCEDDGEDDGDFDPHAEDESSDDSDGTLDDDDVSEPALSPAGRRHQVRLL
ncbi:hypothetical protein AURDEDRAFT_112554 [Auricularia subglabra TFB-10046 SS5]|nr:hypothetical protein AURDEDRAFT_112554 [Auricularia subglabra TFB-10046 SS5]